MFIDHIGYAIYDGSFSNFNYIGRLAFPIFAFQISEGYFHTKNLKKYLSKLFLVSIISQIPYKLFTSIMRSEISLNVMFTLLFGLLAIIAIDKAKNKYLMPIILIFFGILAEALHTDYGYFGVIIIVVFYAFKNNPLLRTFSFTALAICHYAIEYIQYSTFAYVVLCLFTISPIIILNFYNGKQGKKTKFFLYWFYPLHLLLIFFLYKFVI
jgi:hypothetical protein